MGRTLLKKVWDRHLVRELPDGRSQLFVSLCLFHQATSPRAPETLRGRGQSVRCLERTFAPIDYIIPTQKRLRPWMTVSFARLMNPVMVAAQAVAGCIADSREVFSHA